MEFCEERRSRERRQIQERLRRTKIECGILGMITFLLASILAVQVMQKNNRRSEPVHGNAKMQTAGKLGQSDGDGQAMNVQDLLMLVNKDHPLPEGYEVELQ